MNPEIIITRALADGPATLAQITEGRVGEKAAIKRKVGYMVKTGRLVKQPGESAHKSLYKLAGEAPPPKAARKSKKKRKPRRGGTNLPVPRRDPAAAEFIAAVTADSGLLLLRGDERIRLTAEEAQEVAVLVFSKFEQE